MALLKRLSSGKIFVDDFMSATIDPIWEASPTDPSRYSISDRYGYLRLKHGDTPFYMLMNMPNRDFVFEIKLDYTPTIESDTAGIVVFRDIDTRIEFVEYFDSKTGTSQDYNVMRLSKKGIIYSGYGSKDGGATWELIGSISADRMAKVGLVVNYPQTVVTKDFDVDYVKVFGDNKFIVGNLTPGMQVELLDNNGAVIDTKFCQQGKDMVYIDLTNRPIPFNGRLKVYDSSLVLKDTSALMDIWGGDIFWYGLVVEVYRNGSLLSTDGQTELGYLVSGMIEEMFTIKNPGVDPITNVTVSKAPYSGYAGVDWVSIAADASGSASNYSDSVFIGTLNAGEERKIWVRVKKEIISDFSHAGNHKFLLEVTN